MKKGIILYKSKYGAAQKYALWLKEMTGFDCAKTGKEAEKMVDSYEILVLCGGIYASGIAGISFLRKNKDRLQGKKMAVFCVGASHYDERTLEEIKEHNLKNDLKDIPVFYGRGAWDERKMSLVDRTLCRMLQKSVAKKDPADYEPWMEALMCAAGQCCDWTDQRYLEPLMEYQKMRSP